jgi:glutamate 5-kinase
MVALTGRSALPNAKRIVVKVGSALLVDEDKNILNKAWLAGIASDISRLKAARKDVVVVSSGAIALGSRLLKIHNKTLSLQEKQAAAATGQVTLAHAWMEALGAFKVQAAQILLSPDDTETRRKHLNARATIGALLDLGAIPVVNENDTVATAEIRFGDNDRLAARVAAMIGADLLILLSDVDGLYTGNPNQNKDAVHLPQIDHINDDIMAMAGAANAQYASGGMVTKLEAGRISTAAGCHMIICDGRDPEPLLRLENGARCSCFIATETPHAARKQWIAGALKPRGTIGVDAGAAAALRSGKSLLPAGVVAVDGLFDRGDLIAVEDQAGRTIGHGLSSYSAADAAKIKGHKSREIETMLGYRGRDEMIHADNLVMIEN